MIEEIKMKNGDGDKEVWKGNTMAKTGHEDSGIEIKETWKRAEDNRKCDVKRIKE